MNMSLGSCKKRKRGGESWILGFHDFCESGFPAHFNGAFHHNMKTLLQFGRHENPKWNGLETWSFQLELPPSRNISLFVIEEPIEKSMSSNCDHCRFTGWGHHFVSNKRFHFLLPSKEKEVRMVRGDEFSSGGLEVTPISSCLHELQGYLMHGVLHSNGFGHLISLNGVEKGSGLLTGHQIMDFWDRICTSLRARKISLDDIAKKKSMDLRLIHGVAYGEPWFGRWGYKFGHGSYGITQHMHRKALETIRTVPISLLAQQFGTSNQRISEIISKYQTISSNSLRTLGHLFHFMIELKDHLPQEIQFSSNHSHNKTSKISHQANVTCRWSLKRVEMATQVIVEALRTAKTRWVPRQEVRDTARTYIGDTGLLDFVLKALGNHVVGNYMVHRAINPVTKVLEYCLEDLSNSFPIPNQESFSKPSKEVVPQLHVTRTQLMKDLLYLYNNVLKNPRSEGVLTVISTAARIILDTKHLIKDYRGELSRKSDGGDGQERLKFLCTVFLRLGEDGERNKLPPCELIVLNASATVAELKREVEITFREIYLGLRSFVAETIMDVSVQDLDLAIKLAKSSCTLVIAGSIEGKGRGDEGIYERGNDTWIVDCICGAIDDDGERMISCDICEVWQHTRCVRISNSDDVPHIFLCNRCEHDIVTIPSLL